MHPSTRPLTHQRSPLSSSAASALAGRQSHARTNSHSHPHSLLTGALNPTHRITRRKSVTTPGANVAALAAALRESEQSGAIPIASGGRRNTSNAITSKQASAQRTGLVDSLPSPPASLPNNKSLLEAKREVTDSSAIDDDSNELSADEAAAHQDQSRIRRASDGQPLTKDGKKSSRVEVRCETCGKGYKHSSCLTKHLLVSLPSCAFAICACLGLGAATPHPASGPPTLLSSLIPLCPPLLLFFSSLPSLSVGEACVI